MTGEEDMTLTGVMRYWAVCLGVLFLLSIPGLALSLRLRRLSILERLAAAPAFSLVILLIPVPLYRAGLVGPGQWLMGIVTLISLVSLLKMRRAVTGCARFLMFFFIGQLVVKFFLQTLWVHPGTGGDWFLHGFVWPRLLEMEQWVPWGYRGAFFHLLVYSTFKTFGVRPEEFWLTQIVGTVANSLFILPAYLVAQRSFGVRTARFASPLLAFTPFLLFESVYTWPKNLAAYFLLLGIVFILLSESDRPRLVLGGLALGLAVISHGSATGTLAVVMIALVLQRRRLLVWRDLAWILPLSLVVGGHLLWDSFRSGPGRNPLVLYPFCTVSWGQAFGQTTEQIMRVFFSTPVGRHFHIRLWNLGTTLVMFSSRIYLRDWSRWRDNFPSAVGVVLYACALVGMALALRKTEARDKKLLVALVFGSLVLSSALVGYPTEGGMLSLGGLNAGVCLLVIFGAWFIMSLRTRVLAFTLAGLAVANALLEDVLFGHQLLRDIACLGRVEFEGPLSFSFGNVRGLNLDLFRFAQELAGRGWAIGVSAVFVLLSVFLLLFFYMRQSGTAVRLRREKETRSR